MVDFCLPTPIEVFGDNKKRGRLGVFDTLGTKAGATDWAIAHGAYVSSDELTKTAQPATIYYLDSGCAEDFVRTVDYKGFKSSTFPHFRTASIRLSMNFYDSGIPTESVHTLVLNNDKTIDFFECNMYPQKAVSQRMNSILKRELKSSRLKATGNVFTSDACSRGDWDKSCQVQYHQEYYRAGHLYVPSTVHPFTYGSSFSNGVPVHEGETHFFEVFPVVFCLDRASGKAVTWECIEAGRQFNCSFDYNGNFKTSSLYNDSIVPVSAEMKQPVIQGWKSKPRQVVTSQKPKRLNRVGRGRVE